MGFLKGLGDFFGVFSGKERQQNNQLEYERHVVDTQAEEYDKQRAWQSAENDKQRAWQTAENDKQRAHQKYLADRQYDYQKMYLSYQNEQRASYLTNLRNDPDRRSGFGRGYGDGSQLAVPNANQPSVRQILETIRSALGEQSSRQPVNLDSRALDNYRFPYNENGNGQNSGPRSNVQNPGSASNLIYYPPPPTDIFAPPASGGAGVGSPNGGPTYTIPGFGDNFFGETNVSPGFELYLPGQGFTAPRPLPWEQQPVQDDGLWTGPYQPGPKPDTDGPTDSIDPPVKPPKGADTPVPLPEPEKGALFDLSTEDGRAKATASYNATSDKIDAHKTKIDTWVSEGKLTEEQGDSLKAELDDRKAELRTALDEKDSDAFSKGTKSILSDIKGQDSQAKSVERLEDRAEDVLEEIDRLESEGKISAEGAKLARENVEKGLADARSTLSDLDKSFEPDYGNPIDEAKVFEKVERYLEKADLGLDKIAAEDKAFDRQEAADDVENGTSQERIKSETENLKW